MGWHLWSHRDNSFRCLRLISGGESPFLGPITSRGEATPATSCRCLARWGTEINHVVYMHMPKKRLEIIETEASHVFRPFTFDCLNVKS